MHVSESLRIRLALWGAAIFVALLLGKCASECEAQDRYRDELALELARVAANEAFGDPDDVVLIWQVVSLDGRRAESDRLGFLRAHAACATPAGDCDRDGDVDELDDEAARRRVGNARWARFLANDDAEPSGWLPEDGRWLGRGDRIWRMTRSLARRLVYGIERRRVCLDTPSSWGGKMDDERARSRGLERIYCDGTRNGGYRACARSCVTDPTDPSSAGDGTDTEGGARHDAPDAPRLADPRSTTARRSGARRRSARGIRVRHAFA